MISHLIKAWNRFWFAPVSAKPLGAFRIAYGCLAFINVGFFLIVDTDYWLTNRGIFQGDEAATLAGPLRVSFLHYVQDPTWVRVSLLAIMATAAGLAVGWHTKTMSILYYLGIHSLHHRNISTASGADVLVVVIAFCLMLSPCGAAYSLDARRAARRRGGTPAEPLIIPWAQRLIQIQVSLIYLVTVIFKFSGPTWINGTAVHYVLCNTEVNRFDLSSLAGYPILVNIFTYGALVLELALAFFLWSKAARPWMILAGVALHGGIFMMVNIPFFGEMITSCYIVFITSSEWQALTARFRPIAWLKHRLGRPATRPAYRLPSPGRFGAAAEIVKAPTGSA